MAYKRGRHFGSWFGWWHGLLEAGTSILGKAGTRLANHAINRADLINPAVQCAQVNTPAIAVADLINPGVSASGLTNHSLARSHLKNPAVVPDG